ncbi:MAG: type II secretion system GspH family protein [Candidatus Omnitrophica bacterium]|nr:type II secretion system GspH family protein [Candidatus Omnitrophota bacterium]
MIKRKTGFTLIEIIMALAILGIGIVSVMGYLPIALDAAKKASDLTRASMVGQRVLEEVKLAGLDNIIGADSLHTGTNFQSDPFHSEFEYRVIVNPLLAANAKDITVIVRWQSRGNLITEEFETRIPKYNPH